MSAHTDRYLTLNNGSSSMKFALYKDASGGPEMILSGKIERIGQSDASLAVIPQDTKKEHTLAVGASTIKEAADSLMGWLASEGLISDVVGIGHRIVHGMQHSHPEVLTEALIHELQSYRWYDPDHTQGELLLIRAFSERYPALIQVACFDTAFHSTMPRLAKLLPIPRRFDSAGIRKYGFHGLSYAYILQKFKSIAGEEAALGRLVIAHLGSGSSLAAIHKGKSVDTTMGFTPAGGCMMATRTGDLDPGVVWHMLEHDQLTIPSLNKVINHQSGLLGVSETSSDIRDLLANAPQDVRAREAVDLFCYSVKKSIGALAAVLNGIDTLIFTGGVGENSAAVRTQVCQGLDYLGLILDTRANGSGSQLISAAGSRLKAYVIPTNEEYIIAQSTITLINEHHDRKKST